MKKFTRPETISLLVIFLVLIVISIPNFILSLRRARDQVRKDDMGALQDSLGVYFSDFHSFPPASSDGHIMACKNPSDEVKLDKLGRLVVNFVPCEWGKDGIVDLTPGSDKVYMRLLPREPNYEKGSSYHYFSDGQRVQIFVSLEAKDDAEYDPEIIARNIMCGNEVCNAGRNYGCANNKTLAECELEATQK
jgi:hypothetical protein